MSHPPIPILKPGDLTFPDPSMASKDHDGLIAMGGDLSPERLLSAYRAGIFPCFEEPPILWWSPDPRAILYLDQFHVSKSLKRTLNRPYTIKFDTHFSDVLQGCAQPRAKTSSLTTWITPAMISAYETLFTLGYGHCVEVYRDENLIGGVYGLSLGKCFFAESMFSREKDASKVALFYLCKQLSLMGFEWLDCQVWSAHLASLGVVTLERSQFLEKLSHNNKFQTLRGKWTPHPQLFEKP